MKKRISAILLCLLILCTGVFTPAYAAESANNAANEVKKLIGGIVAHKAGESSISTQEWIDTTLASSAGKGAEWYVIALCHDASLDFSAYTSALLNYLSETNVSSAATRQKFALALAAGGERGEYIADVMENSLGQLGIMSWVYGLHLLNNGFESTAATQAEAIDQLLSLQFEDGGWALRGTASDVDITAMVIQALAPFYGTQENVTASIDSAINLLSARQLESGDYASYGAANPESAAQVLIALSSLGIDALSDSRFIKNGNTLLDAIKQYRLDDGSFCHTLGSASNPNATSQVFLGLQAYLLMPENGGNVYMLPMREAASASPAPTVESLGYRAITAIVVSGLALLACAILICMKKRSFKNYLFILILAALVTVFVYTTDFKTAETYYTVSNTEKANPIGTVTLSVRCDTLIGKAESEYIPADGVILENASFPIEEGDTVYNILTEAARAHSMQMDASGPEGMIYITGINYLYEHQFGDLSGWLYFVNGESHSVGCDQYFLKDGDNIEWFYTLAMGEDLK